VSGLARLGLVRFGKAGKVGRVMASAGYALVRQVVAGADWRCMASRVEARRAMVWCCKSWLGLAGQASQGWGWFRKACSGESGPLGWAWQAWRVQAAHGKDWLGSDWSGMAGEVM
jgi:hypothetical protein